LWRVRQLSVDVVAIVNQWIDVRAQQLATAAGIVKKSSIMVVDFAMVAERERHMPPITAILRNLPLRSRPILNPTAVALLAGVPMMFGHGTGSQPRRPLGYAMVGGLTLSQALEAVHNPCGLFLPRPAQAWIQGWHRGAVSDAKALRVRQRARPTPDFVQRIADRAS
jgi:Cu/Ag efflux pump CusA